MIEQIKWLGHGGFVILGPPIIYINPWRITRSAFHADVILIGHHHYDHFSVADIDKVRGPNSIIISNTQVAQQISDVTVLRPWQSLTIDRASIKAIPAYSPDDMRHPKSDAGLGFVISLNYHDIYYAGDTGIIPEMDKIHPDIAILPIDGDGTLTVEDAAQVVKKMRPRWTIPANWGATGSRATMVEVQQFQRLVEGRTKVIAPIASG